MRLDPTLFLRRSACLLVALPAWLGAVSSRAEYANIMPDGEDESLSSMMDLPSSGVSTWAVSEPYVNLWIFSQPMTYTLNHGQPMGFSLAWKHRNNRPLASSSGVTNLFGFGPGWECSWLGYFEGYWDSGQGTCTGTGAALWVPLGGQRQYVADGVTKEFKSSTTLAKTGCTYTLVMPSGAKEIYELGCYVGTGPVSLRITQRIDPPRTCHSLLLHHVQSYL